jgi:hypothetical protein
MTIAGLLAAFLWFRLDFEMGRGAFELGSLRIGVQMLS